MSDQGTGAPRPRRNVFAIMAALAAAASGKVGAIPQRRTASIRASRESGRAGKPYVAKAGNTRFDIARAERAETKRARKSAHRLEVGT